MSITLRLDKRIMLRKPTDLFFSGCRLRLSLIREVRRKNEIKPDQLLKQTSRKKRKLNFSTRHCCILSPKSNKP